MSTSRTLRGAQISASADKETCELCSFGPWAHPELHNNSPALVDYVLTKTQRSFVLIQNLHF